MPHTSEGSDAPGSQRSARPWSFRGRLPLLGPQQIRWFLAELLVVVAGILIALALNAWWEARQNVALERTYLRQLAADLATSDAELDATAEFFYERALASAAVTQSFWRRDTPPPDTLARWLLTPLSSRRTRPVTGTMTTLVSSGDLDLIRSVSLRSAILGYLESSEAHLEDIRRYDETYFRQGVNAVNSILDIAALARMVRGDSIDRQCRGVPKVVARPLPPLNRLCGLTADPTGMVEGPFPLEFERIRTDQRVYRAYYNLLTGHRNQAFQYHAMLNETRSLRQRVQETLGP
jgi:hypothetical protein